MSISCDLHTCLLQLIIPSNTVSARYLLKRLHGLYRCGNSLVSSDRPVFFHKQMVVEISFVLSVYLAQSRGSTLTLEQQQDKYPSHNQDRKNKIKFLASQMITPRNQKKKKKELQDKQTQVQQKDQHGKVLSQMYSITCHSTSNDIIILLDLLMLLSPKRLCIYRWLFPWSGPPER